MIKYEVVSKENFKNVSRSRNNLQGFLKRFEEDDHWILKIDWKESGYSSAGTCSSSIKEAIKKSGLNMGCFMSKNEVFVLKSFVDFDMEEKDAK